MIDISEKIIIAAAITLQIWVWVVLIRRRGKHSAAPGFYAVEPKEMRPSDGLVVVAVFEDQGLAEMCCGILESEGIESVILNPRPNSRYPTIGVGGINVAVNGQDAKRAADVIAEVG